MSRAPCVYIMASKRNGTLYGRDFEPVATDVPVPGRFRGLPIFAIRPMSSRMSTMNISLPVSLKSLSMSAATARAAKTSASRSAPTRIGSVCPICCSTAPHRRRPRMPMRPISPASGSGSAEPEQSEPEAGRPAGARPSRRRSGDRLVHSRGRPRHCAWLHRRASIRLSDDRRTSLCRVSSLRAHARHTGC